MLKSNILALLYGNLIWWLLVAYALAAAFPSAGRWICAADLGRVPGLAGTQDLALPKVLLALLLFNAGLGVRPSHWTQLRRDKRVLLFGLAANYGVPLLFLAASGALLTWLWPEPTEAYKLVIALAIVAAMPVAGSSTAWAQHANGNLALSLGLVIGSTLLAPLTLGWMVHAVDGLAIGEYREPLKLLLSSDLGTFLGMWVLLPSCLGLLCRAITSSAWTEGALPYLKIGNAVILLVLNYANASLSLPQALRSPDPTFLLMTVGTALGMCTLAFSAGYVVARLLRADEAATVSLVYGQGMNNTGAGLVLASLILTPYPRVMVPIVLYTLIQHLLAGGVHRIVWAEGIPRAGGGQPGVLPVPARGPRRV